MPTLRQKVDHFCKDSGAKVDVSDKLRVQVKDLKEQLKKAKDEHKKHIKEMKKTAKVKAEPKAKTKRVKMTDEEKGQRKREKAVTKELVTAQNRRGVAPGEPMMPAPTAMVPVPAPSLAPASPMVRGGRATRRVRRRPVLRW